MEKAIRFLLVRDDYYHQRGYWVIAAAMRDAGIEVILGGIQTPPETVKTATQEDVDIIGCRIMQGAPGIVIPILLDKMKEQGIEDTPVVVGGVVPEKDEHLLRELGVKEIFRSHTPLKTLVERVKAIGNEYKKKRTEK